MRHLCVLGTQALLLLLSSDAVSAGDTTTTTLQSTTYLTLTTTVTSGASVYPTTETTMATGAAVPTGTVSYTGNALQAAVLNSTNYYRAQHQASALTWDDGLATYAQNYANECAWQHSVSESHHNADCLRSNPGRTGNGARTWRKAI